MTFDNPITELQAELEALRTKYEALDARHAEVWYDYEETLTELQNTVSAYDELRTKYEALRTAAARLIGLNHTQGVSDEEYEAADEHLDTLLGQE